MVDRGPASDSIKGDLAPADLQQALMHMDLSVARHHENTWILGTWTGSQIETGNGPGCIFSMSNAHAAQQNHAGKRERYFHG
jgi:hypothetical protein